MQDVGRMQVLLTNLYPASLTTLERQGDDVKKAMVDFGSLTLTLTWTI
jgi:hypothetical protein